MCNRGNIITFRSTGGTILNEFIGNRIEFERAGGVYWLIAGTSARMQSGPGEVKVLMVFEQDAAGAAEAQPARPGIVPVLPSEADVEQHRVEAGADIAYVPKTRRAHAMSRVPAACRSSPPF